MRARLHRFAAVGAVATLVDVAAFVMLRRSGRAIVTADLAALVVAALVSYTLHRVVTFRDDPFERWMRRPLVFLAVAVVSGAVDLLVLFVLDPEPHHTSAALGAKLVAVVVAALVRTVAHRNLLLRVIRRDQEIPARRSPPAGRYRCSVVVPAYNEGERITTTVQRLRTELAAIDSAGGLEIVVVDDGSADDTAARARAAGADVVLVNDPNRGKGGAVRAGVLAASGRTIAFTDADLAYAPQQLVPLLEHVEAGWDVVVGNRRDTATRIVAPTTFVRDLGSKVVNLITQTLLLGQYRDTQAGCKAFRADVARELFAAGRLDGFAFDIELFYLIERNQLSLTALPVEVRNTSTSTVRAAVDGWRLLRDVVRVRRWARAGAYANAVHLPPRAADRPLAVHPPAAPGPTDHRAGPGPDPLP